MEIMTRVNSNQRICGGGSLINEWEGPNRILLPLQTNGELVRRERDLERERKKRERYGEGQRDGIGDQNCSAYFIFIVKSIHRQKVH